MKNNQLIICFLVALVLLPSWEKSTFAQTNIVATNTTMPSKMSIVREYSRDLFLVYNDEGSARTSFSLINISTGTCLTMNLPSIIVNDIEIVNNMAYFCGSIGSGVVVGWFDINSLFYLGGSMSCIVIPTGLSCVLYPSCTEEIISLDKLEIIEYTTGFNHMVMTGRATCSSSFTTNTCIAELYNDGVDYKLAYQVEHEGIFGYDDITITNNEVVLVGHKRSSDGEYLTRFYIPAYNDNMFNTTIPISYPPSYSNPTYGTGDPAYYPHNNSELLVDNIPGTTVFATVCQALVCNTPTPCTEYTCFNLYQNYTTLVYRCRIDDYHDLNYKELKYNSATNSFFLLMEDCSTNMHNGYYEFVLDNTLSYVTNVYFHQEQGLNNYVSLDKCILSTPRSQCVLTGHDSSNKLNIWKHDYANQRLCTKTFNIPFSLVPISIGNFDYDYPYNNIKLTVYSYSDRIYFSELTTFCNE